MEKDLQALTNASASKEDISKVRAEVKKLYDGLHVEFLDLRSHVWGIRMFSACLSSCMHTDELLRTRPSQIVEERFDICSYLEALDRLNRNSAEVWLSTAVNCRALSGPREPLPFEHDLNFLDTALDELL